MKPNPEEEAEKRIMKWLEENRPRLHADITVSVGMVSKSEVTLLAGNDAISLALERDFRIDSFV
jgi:hypothetical protein